MSTLDNRNHFDGSSLLWTLIEFPASSSKMAADSCLGPAMQPAKQVLVPPVLGVCELAQG